LCFGPISLTTSKESPHDLWNAKPSPAWCISPVKPTRLQSASSISQHVHSLRGTRHQMISVAESGSDHRQYLDVRECN
jgi:hypothetical protein